MDGSIQLTDQQRKTLLKAYRYAPDAAAARRAHVLLLLDEGLSYRELNRLLFASNDLIAGCVARFRQGGVSAVLGEDQPPQVVPRWPMRVVRWALTKTPQDFGYFRTRWSCGTLAEVLWWEEGTM